jgi:hypothetical protein
VRHGLGEILPLLGDGDAGKISQKSVKEIARISGSLVALIRSK